MKLNHRFEAALTEKEQLVEKVIEFCELLPDEAAHRNWLMTLSVASLKERLGILERQSARYSGVQQFRMSTFTNNVVAPATGS